MHARRLLPILVLTCLWTAPGWGACQEVEVARMAGQLEQRLQNASPEEFLEISIVLEESAARADARTHVGPRKEAIGLRKAAFEQDIAVLKPQLAELMEKKLLRNVEMSWLANTLTFEAKPLAIFELAVSHPKLLRLITTSQKGIAIPEKDVVVPVVPDDKELHTHWCVATLGMPPEGEVKTLKVGDGWQILYSSDALAMRKVVESSYSVWPAASRLE